MYGSEKKSVAICLITNHRLTGLSLGVLFFAARALSRRGRNCFVASSLNNVSCTNTTYSSAIYMHKFPTDEVLGQKRTSFVV